MHLRPPAPLGLQQSLSRIALLVLLILLMAVLAPILRSEEVLSPPTPPSAETSRPDDSAATLKEDAIRSRLEGKPLFLRVFDLSNDLKFDENGNLLTTRIPGSFTLCAIDVKKVHLSKHHLDIEGSRMGLHFFGALPYQDDTRSFERIRLTKKPIHISIEREEVITPKKDKHQKDKEIAQADTRPVSPANAPFAPESSPAPVDPATLPQPDAVTSAAKAPTTSSPAHSARLLNQAIDKIFAERIDDPLIRTLPNYWQHYFASKAGTAAASASAATIARPGPDVISPRVLSSLEPGSNEFAQKYNIAGVSLFQTVIDPLGHPEVVAVARPLGFGLDERAVEAIRTANFQPGTQAGKPVPVVVDLAVTFRIYSNRTRGSAVDPIQQPEAQKAQVAANP